jgi:hypothetical protein
MAFASTSFMAAPGGFSSTLSVKLDKVDCSQVLAAVLTADTNLLGHIKMGPVGENIEVNWLEDELNPAFLYAKSTYITAMTCSSAYGTTSLQRIVRVGTIIQPNEAEWAMQIATLNTGVGLNPAATAYGSTTWAQITTMTKCYLLAQPYADISDASTDISVKRQKRKNFMQVFERAIQIEQTRKNMAMEAVTDELQLQIKRRTLEIKRELEMSIIRGYGYVSASNTLSGDIETRTMCGLIQLIRDPDLDTTNEDSTVINLSAALTAGAINSLVNKIYEAGGFDETSDCILVAGPKQARIIAAMEKELRRVEQGERQVGYYRNVFLSDMGNELPIVMTRWFPGDKIAILDRSRMMIRPMKGDAWHMEKMAKTGRSEKWQLSGQYTFVLEQADKCHGLIYNAS